MNTGLLFRWYFLLFCNVVGLVFLFFHHLGEACNKHSKTSLLWLCQMSLVLQEASSC